MSSHSKSGAIIGLDSSMGFNHAAVMFGGKKVQRRSTSTKKSKARSPRMASIKTDVDEVEQQVDMTPPEERLTSYAIRCVEYEEQHEFDHLLTARTHCLALSQLCFGKAHPEVTLAHVRLGRAYLRRRLYPQAESHAQTAIERLVSIPHENANEVRYSALSTLGQAYIGMKQFTKAEPPLKEAEELNSAPNTAEKCDLMVALAAVQTQRRFFADTVDTLEKAIVEKLQSVTETHPDMLAIFLRLGQAYIKLSTNTHEEKLAAKAADALTKAVNVGIANSFVFSLDMGDALFNLGVAHAATNNVDGALQNFERSLKVYRHIHGKKSAPVARALRQIAFLFIKQRNLENGLVYLGLVIKAEARLHGPNSIQVADLIKTRGDVHLLTNNFDEAIESLKEAAVIYEILSGNDCPEAADCRERIAHALDLQANNIEDDIKE